MTQTALSIAYYRTFVAGLALLAAASVLFYIGFMAATMFATAERTAAYREGKALTSAIGELESSYFALEQAITPEEAARRGLVAPVQVSFTSAQNTGFSLSDAPTQ